MTNTRWIIAYRILFFPLLFVGFWICSLFDKKIKKGFQLRRKVDGVYPWLAFPKQTQPVWFHCASGEFEYIKPVIKKLKEARPDQKILVTYFSPTYADNIKTFKGVDMACPLPWDRWSSVKEFLLHHRPRCLLISRTDVWPELLHQCYSKGILTLLFSATLSEKSSKVSHHVFRAAFRWMYSYISGVYCVSEKDKENFSKIVDPLNLHVIGDTRFDQVQERLKTPKNVRRELNPNFKQETFLEKIHIKDKPFEPIFVAGSTWDEDEAVIIPAVNKVRKSLRLMLAPHEPTPQHLEEIKYRFHALDWPYILYSEATHWPHETALIIDQVGILADLYGWGQMAFVGGSFRKTVHSVMEPLASGCLTFVGPYHQNNREALEFKNLKYEDTFFVQEIQSSEQLHQKIVDATSLDFTKFQEDLKTEMLKRTGASKAVVDWILSKISI